MINYLNLQINLVLTLFRYTKYKFFNSKKFNYIFLNSTKKKNFFKVCSYFKLSKSEFRQDLFVLNQLNFKKNGYFVEFGATNGLKYSNTYLLEKKFFWKGILAEPSKSFHRELTKNRNCNVEKKIVWKNSNSKLVFCETYNPTWSTIKKYMNKDLNKRHLKKEYMVKSISLNNLLEKYNAPKIIDYLSIDVEGTELDILSNFNFNNYKFKIITCEHNYTPARKKIYKLLKNKGYKRILSNISQVDDWYINSSIV